MMANLTKKQLETLKIHKKSHTSEHMKFMKNKIKQGGAFTQAHKQAMKKVGK